MSEKNTFLLSFFITFDILFRSEQNRLISVFFQGNNEFCLQKAAFCELNSLIPQRSISSEQGELSHYGPPWCIHPSLFPPPASLRALWNINRHSQNAAPTILRDTSSNHFILPPIPPLHSCILLLCAFISRSLLLSPLLVYLSFSPPPSFSPSLFPMFSFSLYLSGRWGVLNHPWDAHTVCDLHESQSLGLVSFSHYSPSRISFIFPNRLSGAPPPKHTSSNTIPTALILMHCPARLSVLSHQPPSPLVTEAVRLIYKRCSVSHCDPEVKISIILHFSFLFFQPPFRRLFLQLYFLKRLRNQTCHEEYLCKFSSICSSESPCPLI